ncbi:MAG: oligopeptide transport system substrate-binding protein [Acidobacteriota bacterium]|jgi:oligopeptide transport system substrate-binding protein|nr:oligopeptide transport system substrate-binding protein [Acidobacteriota bacterium]
MKARRKKIFRRDGARKSRRVRGGGARLWLSLAVSGSLLFGGCFREEKGERFYGKVAVPASQEFRWSDGGLPKVFDPARAAAPPDTDAVRALYEGLTDYEPGTLRPIPAAASRWESADDGRRWTFHLREGARWTNGDPVTAEDFVRSWQRTLRLGEQAPHAVLLSNIEGAQTPSADTTTITDDAAAQGGATNAAAGQANNTQGQAKGSRRQQATTPLGVVAVDARTLRVTLLRPDKNFPALVAHPVFRPVHELSAESDLEELREEQKHEGSGRDLGIITNGAFSLARLEGNSVELERAVSYWDAASVGLERVRFVDGDTEAALASYRAGDVDVVSNAAVEPLAVKLLTPYEDFRRETFAALNYYRFNTARPPFDDLRVRQALALALDTERLSADTLGGATEPTHGFLPTPEASDAVKDENVKVGAEDASTPAEESRRDAGDEAVRLVRDVGRARRLLDEAGYPGGVNFPRIRLLVNRNEQQRIVAQAVARMWREALGVETEVLVRPWEEYEAMLRAGDYDVARRSLVMQTTDEETNMLELFGDAAAESAGVATAEASPKAAAPATPAAKSVAGAESPRASNEAAILTEAQALKELPAIPLHFASSYALVKPYVDGFESNLLDSPSLKHVRINTQWRAPEPESSAQISQRAARRF